MKGTAEASAAASNVRKIDFLMSPTRDLPARPQGASMRYVLCSSPRCGSNLAGQMLHETGLAGDPQEYLNSRYIDGFLRVAGEGADKMDIAAYFALLEQRRTSPNGVFGVKIHYDHLTGAWPGRPAAAVKFLQHYDKFILITRRDKIAQAVSLYKARVTQIWSTLDYRFLEPDDPRRSIKPEFDASLIADCLKLVVDQAIGWRRLLEKNGFVFAEVCYEDLVADYVGESRRLLRYLGLDPETTPIAAPTLKKQGVDNDPMVARFRQVLGVDRGESA